MRRLLLWVPAAAVAVVQAVWALRLPDRFADLHVYRGSVLAMRHGGSLYSYVAANGDPFTYPPFAGLVLYPAGWPIDAAWMVLTFGAVVWCAFLVAPGRAPLVCLALLLSAPVVRDLRFGQVSLFLALLVLLDALRWKRGIATGVASAVKLTPLVFVPYLWLAGHRRAALTALGTFLGCTALAWLVLPRDSVRYWFTELWHTDRIGNLALSGNQSLNGLLLRAGVSSHAVWLALALVVLAVGLWRASRSRDPLTGVVIAGAVCVAVSPVSWTHHQIWLVFAAFCAVGRSRVVQAVWTASVLIVMTVPALVNGRAFLALAIACVVPFTSVGRLEHAEADRRGG